MTLRDLVLTMNADEKLLVREPGYTDWLECTPDVIINDFDTDLQQMTVATIQMSKAFNAIMIELE